MLLCWPLSSMFLRISCHNFVCVCVWWLGGGGMAYRHSTSKGFVTAYDRIPWWRAAQQDWYLFLQRASEQNQGPGACLCWRWGSDLSARSCLRFGKAPFLLCCFAIRNPPFYSTKNIKSLFGCTIHFNSCVLEWIRVELSLISTPIHFNTHGLR